MNKHSYSNSVWQHIKQGGDMVLNPGDIIDNTYVVEREIGSGSLGVIYKAYHMRLEKYVVLKRIKLNMVSYDKLRLEVDLLKQLRHQYLPQVYDYFSFGGEIYTSMDYIDGKDLKHMMAEGAKFSQEQLIKWLRQLCSVLKYIHNFSPPVFHSDIKPENIMIDRDGNVCLIDFNIAGGQGLTADYASPEQISWFNMYLNGDPRYYECSIDGRSDIYSLGSTFYNLMTNITPNILKYQIPLLVSYSGLQYTEAFAEIVDKMRSYDINDRFQTADEILYALDNIKKSDLRYKKYILAQVFGAVIFVLFLVLGAYMILYGNSIINRDNIYSKYMVVTDLYKKGDYDEAINKGIEMLNKGYINTQKNKSEAANILYLIGNSAFESEKYEEAVRYYSEVYKYVDFIENKSDYYINYSIALAKSDDLPGALSIVKKAELEGMNTSDIMLINSEISFIKGEYNSALSNIKKCIDSSVDNNKKAKCYVLLAEIYDKNAMYKESISYYKKALQYNELPNTLRKCANEYIIWNQKLMLDDIMYRENLQNAEKCIEKIYKNYTMEYEDYINLGNLNKSIGNYDIALKVLNEGKAIYSKDYKIYLYLALTYEEMGDTYGAAENAAIALQYSKNSDISDKDYKMLEKIYKQYY